MVTGRSRTPRDFAAAESPLSRLSPLCLTSRVRHGSPLSQIFYAMESWGLARDAITYSAVISALSKGRQWSLAIDVFNHMCGHEGPECYTEHYQYHSLAIPHAEGNALNSH